MKQSIYLHSNIVSILKCYGDLDDVINRIIDDGIQGAYDIMDKPPCPGRDGAGRYTVDIIQPDYLNLLESYGATSPKLSIRRLIYWFVDNEMFEELGWEQINKYQDKDMVMLKKKLANITSELQMAKRHTKDKYVRDKLEYSYIAMKRLEEYLDDGREFT